MRAAEHTVIVLVAIPANAAMTTGRGRCHGR
jgi:hypothetical protein